MIHKAKKSLGQNFLKSEPALNMMCTAGEVNNKDIILEIGPGKGALTKKLLEKSMRVVAIEKDRDLIELLKEKFAKEIEENKLILIEEDILDLNINKTNFKKGKYKIIANIPYNITGGILKKFLSDDIKPERMILLVQKEVAQRIVAKDNKESILSISVKCYGTPKYIMKVEKRFFSPSPKVDSAIISITNISNNNFKNKKVEELFFNIVKSGFSHKRKILIKNLESVISDQEKLKNLFEKLNINLKTRAENIKIEKWVEISHHLSTEI